MKANVGILHEAHLLAPPSGPNTVNVKMFIYYLMTEGCRAFEALCVFNRNRILEEVICIYIYIYICVCVCVCVCV